MTTVEVMDDGRSARAVGRPGVTSREDIEEVAFELFEQYGYEQTSMARIADELGVGRRTIFRYFESKHEIPWSGFDQQLPRFVALLAAQPAQTPVWSAVMSAVLEFNDAVMDSSRPVHILRLRLIMGEPSLQAHSALRYSAWRRVIEEFVAQREGCEPDDALPKLVAYAINAVAIAGFTQWLRDTAGSLHDAFAQADALLRATAANEPGEQRPG